MREGKANTPLTDVFDAFSQARSNMDDERWAERAAWMLLHEQHVGLAAIRETLTASLHLLERADEGESAQSLFGDAEEWAGEKVAQWREDGLDVFEEDMPASPRDIVVYGLGIGAAFAVVLWMFMVPNAHHLFSWSGLAKAFVPSWPVRDRALRLADGMFPLMQVVLPVAIVVICLTMYSVYQRVLRARSYVLGIAAAIASAAAGLGVYAAYMVVVGDAWHVDFAWMLVAGLAYAAAAYGLGGIWKAPEQARPLFADDLSTDDKLWLDEVARLLRARGDMTDGHVARICDRAAEHVRRSGTPLVEEFGTASEYAHRFATTGVAERRRMVFWALWAVLAIIVFVARLLIPGGHTTWWQVVKLVSLIVVAVCAYMSWREVKRRRSSETVAS